MSDNRNCPRTPMKCSVKISHPEYGEMTANTRDISDGGIFLMTSTTELYPLGTVLQGQVQNMGVQAPVLNMEIVRIDDDGIALKFLT